MNKFIIKGQNGGEHSCSITLYCVPSTALSPTFARLSVPAAAVFCSRFPVRPAGPAIIVNIMLYCIIMS